MEQRAFGHGFGPGFGRPFFRPFPHPFFPGRFLYPYFFFSPFYYPYPFIRDSGGDDLIFATHQAKAGDTLAAVGHAYNMPHAVLEEANPHLNNPNQLQAGEVVYIPRISVMLCHKGYAEMPAEAAGAAKQQP